MAPPRHGWQSGVIVSAFITKIIPWAIIIASEEARRVRPSGRYWESEEPPHQFYAAGGLRSPLQRAIDRASQVVEKRKIVVAVGHGQRRFVDKALDAPFPGEIIEQPVDRGTAAGLFLAVAHVLNRNADATVLVLSPDIALDPEDRFAHYAARAYLLAVYFPTRMILLGAPPEWPETHRGWVVPAAHGASGEGQVAGCEVLPIAHFHKTPKRSEAESLCRNGALLNTGIVAADAALLWDLGEKVLPLVASRLKGLRTALSSAPDGSVQAAREAFSLSSAFEGLEPADFSRDLLEHSACSTLALRMEGVRWIEEHPAGNLAEPPRDSDRYTRRRNSGFTMPRGRLPERPT